jgi:protein-S-isoprenylcysteine O-methyltransferase Ste14
MVKLPGITLAGRSAFIALVVLALLIVALLAYLKPQISPSPLWVSAGLWILFIGYWNAVAKNAAQEKRSESQESRCLHQNLMSVALLLLFIPVPGLRWRFLPASPFIVAAGLAIHVGSILLAVWARRHLGRNWSGAITVKVDHQLVRTGPYRLVRHPIYSAMLGMFAGTVIVSGTLHALLAMAIISLAYWRKIRLEEQSLGHVFGPAYDAYRRDTWALFPGLF